MGLVNDLFVYLSGLYIITHLIEQVTLGVLQQVKTINKYQNSLQLLAIKTSKTIQKLN